MPKLEFCASPPDRITETTFHTYQYIEPLIKPSLMEMPIPTPCLLKKLHDNSTAAKADLLKYNSNEVKAIVVTDCHGNCTVNES